MKSKMDEKWMKKANWEQPYYRSTNQGRSSWQQSVEGPPKISDTYDQTETQLPDAFNYGLHLFWLSGQGMEVSWMMPLIKFYQLLRDSSKIEASEKWNSLVVHY